MSDQGGFRRVLDAAQHVAVLTGAGVSAESGVPTFRGAGGLWRQYSAMDIATPEVFARDPSLVWEFYHYRRRMMGACQPNRAHLAIAALQDKLEGEGRRFTLVTQNIDRLHHAAGSTDVIEMHGSLWLVRCTRCGEVNENRDDPICPALEGKGAPEPDAHEARIPKADLPRCRTSDCGGLLRPHVVWFGEMLDPTVMMAAHDAMSVCDLMMVVGTSAVVYPAAAFAPMVAGRGVPVAEFNLEATPTSGVCQYTFEGKAGETLPDALGVDVDGS